MLLRLFSYFTFGMIILLTTGCQDAITFKDDPQLIAEYYVRYLESDRQIKAYATFHEGDSLSNALPKTFLGGVSFRGSGMEPRAISNQITRYTITQTE